MRALDRKLLRDVWAVKTQALAIALVLASGVAMVVLSRTTLDSLQLTQAEYYRRYAFADAFVSCKRAPEAVARRLQGVPGVSAVQTRVVAAVSLDLPTLLEPATGLIVSMPEEGLPPVNGIYLRTGRLPEPGRAAEVLVNEAFAEAHGYAHGQQVRVVINGRRQDLDIVGVALSPEYVYSIKPGSFFPDDLRYGVFWMRRPALAAAFGMEGAFNDASFVLSPDASLDAVLEQVDRILEPHGGLGAYRRRDQVSDFYVSGELEQLSTMSWIAPTIFLVVAAFLVNMVLARLVSTQREQVALLKAFGYSNARVALHFLQLVLLIVAVGSVLGVLAGIALGRDNVAVYAQWFHFPELRFHLEPGPVVAGLLVGALAAVVGALGAVAAVARLPPAESMRPPAPDRFRPLFIERLGLGTLLSPAARMVLRQLERRPWRATFSVIGMSFGVAILVMGPALIDALDRIVDLQFRVAERQDVTVTFTDPRGPEALHALRRLPGVLRAEPLRAVPVRLRAGWRERRVSLLGLPGDSDLHRLVDAAGRPVPIPPDGILVSSKLASLLGVEAGDRLVVEVLEGERPVREAVVADLSDEFLGLSATMEIGALRRLLREGRTLSAAEMVVDPRHEDALYSELRQTPLVAGLSLKRAAIEAFEKTLAEGMVRMAVFNLVFASIIAFGVVYNSARIALSERARELASLRVLGFTRGEVSAVLLGEMALLTLLALPVGGLVGYGLVWLMTRWLDTDLYRLPFVVNPATWAFAFVVTLLSAAVSALVVRRRIDRFDLVAVLKTRE